MTKLRSLLDLPDTSFAVVGATDTPGKYGGRIYRDLKRKGFKVYAINPNRDTVDGDPAWPALSDLEETPSMAVLVVPAHEGLRVVADAAIAGVGGIWVQPGAYSSELGEALDAGSFDWLSEACVMVETLPVSRLRS